MNESSSKFKVGRAKFNFPPYHQEEPTSCGPACLRMLAEWAGSEHPRTEKYWQDNSAWKEQGLLPPKDMRAALTKIREISLKGGPTKAEVAAWRADSALPADATDRGTVYLLHTDSYDLDGVNIGHWIVLLDIIESRGPRHGQPRVHLARCADPSSHEDEVSVWTWSSLLESRVTHAFRVTRVPAAAGGS